MGNVDDAKKKKYDPNVVGLGESSDEDSSESDEVSDEAEIIDNAHSAVKGGEESIVNVENEGKNKKENGDVLANTNKDEKKQNNEIKNDSQQQHNNIEVNKIKNNNKEGNIIKNNKKEEKQVKKPLLEHPTMHVDVNRDPKVQVARLKLPILGEEQRIMELVNENEFLIVAGETG